MNSASTAAPASKTSWILMPFMSDGPRSVASDMSAIAVTGWRCTSRSTVARAVMTSLIRTQ